jgi:hypothetical protein
MSRHRRSASEVASSAGGTDRGKQVIYIAVLAGLLAMVLFSLSRTGESLSQVLFGTVAPADGSGDAG